MPKIFKDIDWVLVAVTMAICAVGIAALYSVEQEFAVRQMIWVCLGLFVMGLALILGHRRFIDAAYISYIVIAVLLLVVLATGRIGGGAARWIRIGPFNFQPSEFAKIIFVLTLARYLGTKKELFFSSGGGFFEKLRWPEFLISWSLMMLPAGLILVEPDLGTALVFFPIVLGMLYIWGVKLRYIFYSVGAAIGLAPVFWLFLKDYQRDRLLVFINPNSDPLGAGYTILQSKIAIGSGGLFGKGWFGASQAQLKFLPERHSDFIFSVIGEQWGFAGAFLLILLFILFVRRLVWIMHRAKEPSARLIVAGLLTVISFQVFVNIGMTCGILPVVGVPLPFVTYGGSSMIVLFFGVGLALSVGRR